MRLFRIKLLETYSRKKYYAYHKARDISFNVGDQVLLKVSPLKRVMRYCQKYKLSPWYINLFKVLNDIGKFA